MTDTRFDAAIEALEMYRGAVRVAGIRNEDAVLLVAIDYLRSLRDKPEEPIDRRWCSRCGDELSPEQQRCDDECAAGAGHFICGGAPTSDKPTPHTAFPPEVVERFIATVNRLRDKPTYTDGPALASALSVVADYLQSERDSALRKVAELEAELALLRELEACVRIETDAGQDWSKIGICAERCWIALAPRLAAIRATAGK